MRLNHMESTNLNPNHKHSPAKHFISGLRFSFLLVASLLFLSGCNQIRSLQPAQAPQEVAKGAVLLQHGDRNGAIAAFDLAINQHRTDIMVYQQIAAICEAGKQWDLAAKYAEQSLAAVPDAPAESRCGMLMIASSCYLNNGDKQKAIELAQAAYKLQQDKAVTLNNLGYMYAEAYDLDMPGGADKLKEADALISKAISKARDAGAPDDELGMYVDSAGWVYYKLHNYKEAVSTLARATNLTPNQKEIHYHLGMAYKQTNQYPQALTEFNRALAIDDQYPDAIKEKKAVQALVPSVPQSPPIPRVKQP
jgi:tetratricopeptide (TPR) repeat protein